MPRKTPRLKAAAASAASAAGDALWNALYRAANAAAEAAVHEVLEQGATALDVAAERLRGGRPQPMLPKHIDVQARVVKER